MRHPVPRLAAVALFVAALAGGCAGREDAPARDVPAALPEAEIRRGNQACEAYVAQACGCAERRSDRAELAEICHMAPAKQSSLNAVVEVNRTTSDVDERLATERTARRIIESCIEGQSDLLAKGCAGRAQP